MCGGGLGQIANVLSPVASLVNGGWTGLRNGLETSASLLGNYELPGSSLLTDQLVSKGSQGQLGSTLGQLAQVASGAAGSGFGSGVTGIPQSAGGALEANALSNFANSTGLSSLYGGTSQPADALNADYGGISSTPGSADLASSASTPNFSAGNTLTTGGGNALATGGGTLGTGGTDALAGESFAAPSASGIGASGGLGSDAGTLGSSIGGTSSLGAGAENGVSFNPSLFSGTGDTGVASSSPFSGIGSMQGGSGLSNLFGSATGSPNIPSGSYNYDFGGNPVGTSALSPNDPAYAATASNNLGQGGGMGSLSSLLGGGSTGGAASGANSNMLNGLLRGGLGYLLNNPNNAGKNAINQATGQAEANFAPYLAAGNAAEGQLANLYGNNGTAAQNTAFSNFQNTPGYQFALNQGLNAINANAAAMGSPLSGNNQQAVNNYAQGTANQTYNNYVNQLQNLASGGMSAAGGAGTAGLTGAAARAQVGQNNANAQNSAIGQGLEGLFSTGMTLQQLLGNNNNGGGLLSYL